MPNLHRLFQAIRFWQLNETHPSRTATPIITVLPAEIVGPPEKTAIITFDHPVKTNEGENKCQSEIKKLIERSRSGQLVEQKNLVNKMLSTDLENKDSKKGFFVRLSFLEIFQKSSKCFFLGVVAVSKDSFRDSGSKCSGNCSALGRRKGQTRRGSCVFDCFQPLSNIKGEFCVDVD